MFSRLKRLILAPLQWLSFKRGGLTTLVIALTGAGIYLLVVTRPVPALAPVAERVWVVEAIEVNAETVQPVLTVYGEVVVGRRGEIRALVPGLVVKTGSKFREGTRVQKGDLLVGIDPFNYENQLTEQQARLDQARTRLEILQLEYQRTRTLHQKGTVSQQALDEVRLATKQQESIASQVEVGVKRAQRDLTETQLRAPFDGLLHDLNANLGKKLAINDRVTDLIDTGSLEVKFSLSNSQFGRLLESDQDIVGRPVIVSWQVGNRIFTYDARVERHDARISSTTGGISIYAVIEETDPINFLRPGAFVSVEMADKNYQNIFTVPDSARYANDSVYIIDEDSRLQKRQIDIQGYDGSLVLFRSSGEPPIQSGDQIMTTQLREGGAGIKVEVR